MYQQISISSILLGLLIYSIYAEEVLIQIVVKKPINIVSDRYVSFSIDPGHLLDLCLRQSTVENATILAKNLGSAYFKINGDATNHFTLDYDTVSVNENQVRILPSDWQALHQWISETNLKPIVSLPYSSKQWSPRNVISILGLSNRLGVRNCIWQLESEFNSTETIDYVDALSTLKTINDVFRKNGSDWSVIGADINPGCKAGEADLYAELTKHISEANGWTQRTEYNSLESDDHIFLEKDPALRSLLRSKTPVWLNVLKLSQSLSAKNELCGEDCESQGMRLANILGTSAQSGFNVVFQRVDKSDLINPSLKYYVSVLHKRLMGNKVFDTKVLNADSLSPKFFTHCARNMSGSFSVMGVNGADHRTKTSTKLPTKYTGSEVHQYILNVDMGHIFFNGAPIEITSDLPAVIKFKKQNRLTTFSLPPRSIGFWVFPRANLQQCSAKSDVEIGPSTKQEAVSDDFDTSSKTASEKLLHELISEIVRIDIEKNEVKRSKRHAIVKKDSLHMKRIKRSADTGYKTRRAVNLFRKFNDEAAKPNLGIFGHPSRRIARQINTFNYHNNNYGNRFGKLFKNFELPQPKKFQLAKFWNLPSPTQNVVTQNRVDIPPITSTVHDVYRVDPSEQIFKSVENSELPTGDVFFQVGDERNMDYVEFDEKSDNHGKHRQPNEQRMVKEKFVEFDDDGGVGMDETQYVPHNMYEFHNEAKNREQPKSDPIPYTELWESDVYQKAPPPQPTDERINYDVDVEDNQEQNIDLIVKELPPTFRQNQENLMKAKNKLNSIYMSDGEQKSSKNNKPNRFDMDYDGFFVSKRKRRSVNDHLNDEIESKVENQNNEMDNNGEAMIDFIEYLGKNGSKINLLEKIDKIITSLEKIDDIAKYKNLDNLNTQIKELENFLFKRNSKFGMLKPKNRAAKKDVRRKCKILSVNLEQQCLRENEFRFINRDAKASDYKVSKIPALKNVFPSKKSDSKNRVRRNAVYESSSWEGDQRNNMIVKEIYTANELNDYAPPATYKRTVVLNSQPNAAAEGEYIAHQISVLQNLPDTYLPNNVIESKL